MGKFNRFRQVVERNNLIKSLEGLCDDKTLSKLKTKVEIRLRFG